MHRGTPPVAACFAALALQCGPPVAREPAPTPVYADHIDVAPLEILHHSLQEEVQQEPSVQPTPAAPEPEPKPERESESEGESADEG